MEQTGEQDGKKNEFWKHGKQFSKEYQPKRGQTGKKTLTSLLKKQLNERQAIIVEGEDVVTGQKVKVKIPMPTDKVIVATLCRSAAKGNLKAIDMIFDRLEGKPILRMQPLGEDDPPPGGEQGNGDNQSHIILSDGSVIPFPL